MITIKSADRQYTIPMLMCAISSTFHSNDMFSNFRKFQSDQSHVNTESDGPQMNDTKIVIVGSRGQHRFNWGSCKINAQRWFMTQDKLQSHSFIAMTLDFFQLEG